ncbi:MAG: hypothetical protein LC792_16955 [Actinobacteria bacterium]|nr:hypothetical protein [Actinomycetota bacterium]
MIVSCAYCGPLPADLLERLGEFAWGQHIVDEHPDWPELKVVLETAKRRHSDGTGCAT